MDVERTLDFVVKTLADVVARQQQAEVRAARTDRQIEGLRTIVKTGMKMMVKLGQGHKSLQAELKELAAAQKRTDAALARTDQRFDRWLDSVNKGMNGNKKRSN